MKSGAPVLLAALLTAASVLATPVPGASAQSVCPPPAETVTAAAIRADGTILLSDGRNILLAGTVLGPDATGALAALAEGQTLTIRPLGKPDRWGRQSAHVDGVEEKLIAEGLGHAASLVPGACIAPLLAAEARARDAGIGLWSRPGYVLAAIDGEALTARRGHSVIVEGEVVSVGESRGRVYLNFARYWKSGLSLIIAENNWPMFAGGASAESLVGRRLRVRGRLEHRVGPAILAGPDDRIEFVTP